MRTVYKDCVLYKEGDRADFVYIIKEGEFVITKRFIQKTKQTENIQEILDNPQRACKSNNKLFNKNIIKKIDKHTIAFAANGNLLGEDDVCNIDQDNEFAIYTSSAKCVSKEALLMVIQRDDFMKL
jgi:CRP-like cAMP-binding protein